MNNNGCKNALLQQVCSCPRATLRIVGSKFWLEAALLTKCDISSLGPFSRQHLQVTPHVESVDFINAYCFVINSPVSFATPGAKGLGPADSRAVWLSPLADGELTNHCVIMPMSCER